MWFVTRSVSLVEMIKMSCKARFHCRLYFIKVLNCFNVNLYQRPRHWRDCCVVLPPCTNPLSRTEGHGGTLLEFILSANQTVRLCGREWRKKRKDRQTGREGEIKIIKLILPHEIVLSGGILGKYWSESVGWK